MFSGIVEYFAKAEKIIRKEDAIRAYFKQPHGWKLKTGDSLSIDGVCTTIENIQNGTFSVYLMAETLRRSNLSKITDTHLVNFERCLTLNSLVGGHLVSGHVDTTAEVMSIEVEGESKVLRFKIDPRFTKYIIYKGSITVNGVSLTIVSVDSNSFTVSLIPYTLDNTNLGNLKILDWVNIEVDLIAKYLEKLAFGQSKIKVSKF